jgi:hypothetical protein
LLDFSWIIRGFLHHCGHILLKIMLLQDICYPELPHIEAGSSFEPILGPDFKSFYLLDFAKKPIFLEAFARGLAIATP